MDEETFERVQELRRNKRRPAKTGKTNLFSGVAYCADCGEKMYYCTTQNFEERQDHFVCSTSRKKGKDVCGTHFIRAVVLEKGVLRFLQILLWYISDCESLFREKLGAKRKEDFKKELSAKRRSGTGCTDQPRLYRISARKHYFGNGQPHAGKQNSVTFCHAVLANYYKPVLLRATPGQSLLLHTKATRQVHHTKAPLDRWQMHHYC